MRLYSDKPRQWDNWTRCDRRVVSRKCENVSDRPFWSQVLLPRNQITLLVYSALPHSGKARCKKWLVGARAFVVSSSLWKRSGSRKPFRVLPRASSMSCKQCECVCYGRTFVSTWGTLLSFGRIMQRSEKHRYFLTMETPGAHARSVSFSEHLFLKWHFRPKCRVYLHARSSFRRRKLLRILPLCFFFSTLFSVVEYEYKWSPFYFTEWATGKLKWRQYITSAVLQLGVHDQSSRSFQSIARKFSNKIQLLHSQAERARNARDEVFANRITEERSCAWWTIDTEMQF